MPQTITIILPVVKSNPGLKCLSSSFILPQLKSDLTKLWSFYFAFTITGDMNGFVQN